MHLWTNLVQSVQNVEYYLSVETAHVGGSESF